MHDDAEFGARSDDLAVPESLGTLPQMVEIGRVPLSLDPQAPGGGGEGFLDAGVVPMDDHDVGAVAGGQAVENGRGELTGGFAGVRPSF